MKILFKSCVSACIDLEDKTVYYSKRNFDVYLNNKLVIKDENRNVFSLYDLTPGTEYILKVNNSEFSFTTDRVNKIYNFDKKTEVDVTEDLQKIIDNAEENSLITVKPGLYKITSLVLKSDITFNLEKGATLKASTNENDYKEIDGEEIVNGKVIQRGTWEGDPHKIKLSFLNTFDAKNVKIVGEGVVDGDSQHSTWFENFRQKPYARPHMLFINNSKNVYVQGITFCNSAQWTIHPYFSDDIGFYNIFVKNDYNSPNTDAIDPQCCKNVDIIGCVFSVGDDCISIKSGKIYIGTKFTKPAENININNCYMKDGHGAVVLGSELGSGLKNIHIERCIFEHTDRGLRIKTRRGRGKNCNISNVVFDNIIMKNVLSPITMNMFYFCDPDGKEKYVWDKEKLPVDERTPRLGTFTFKNIVATDCEYCVCYCYGLPEQYIDELNFVNCDFSMKQNAGEGTPLMMTDAEVCSKRGMIFKNVNKVIISNIRINGQVGDNVDAQKDCEVIYG